MGANVLESRFKVCYLQLLFVSRFLPPLPPSHSLSLPLILSLSPSSPEYMSLFIYCFTSNTEWYIYVALIKHETEAGLVPQC